MNEPAVFLAIVGLFAMWLILVGLYWETDRG